MNGASQRPVAATNEGRSISRSITTSKIRLIDLDMAGLLLRKGADATIKDDSNLTPLEFAEHFKSRSFAKRLKALWLETRTDPSNEEAR